MINNKRRNEQQTQGFQGPCNTNSRPKCLHRGAAVGAATQWVSYI